MDRIVLFDGICNYCNAMVNFTIARDHEKRFRFAPLQSSIGVELRKEYGIGDDIDSVILVEDGNAYVHSTAALRIARGLGGLCSLAYILVIIPGFIRDWAYKLFAKYRYRMFGRTEACMMPTPEIKDRFLA